MLITRIRRIAHTPAIRHDPALPAAGSLREARKATILCAFLLVAWTFFFFIGSCLFEYFKVFPNATVQAMQATSSAVIIATSSHPA
jgi:hypothetical protein